MPAAGNTIEASFGLDLSALKAGFAQAETIARTGATKVATAINQTLSRTRPINWNNVLNQTAGGPPGRPPPRSYPPARPGQYPSPLAEDAGGGRGGLPRGIGQGLGLLAGIHQLTSAYKEAAEAAGKLFEANAAIFRPIGGGTAVGLGDLEKRLSDISEVNDQIRQRERIEQHKRDSRSPGGLLDAFESAMKGGRQLVGMTLGQGTFAEQDAAEAAEKARRQQEAVAVLAKMAEKQKELNAIEMEGVSGSEEQASLMKAELGNRERLLKIAEQESKLGVQGHSELADAENERYRLQVEGIKQVADIKQRELTLDAHLAQIEAEGASAEKLKITALRDQLTLIQEQLSASKQLTQEERTQLQTAETRAKTRLLKEKFAQRFLPGEGSIIQTPEDIERADYNHFLRERSRFGARSRHLDMSGDDIDPLESSTLEQTFARVPDAYNEPRDREFFESGRPYKTPYFKSELGDLDRHMMPLGHMALPGHMNRFGEPPPDDYSDDDSEDGKSQPVKDATKDNSSAIVTAVNGVTQKMQELWGG